MHSSWLYQLDTFCIIVALLVMMALAGEVGCRVGHHWQPRADDARRKHLGLVLGSLLGLLALLLGFTFAMSADRYDRRRQLVVNDANALQALFLQSRLLPDTSRKAFKQLLGQYFAERVKIAHLRHDMTDEEQTQAAARSESTQDEMWALLKSVAEGPSPPRIAENMLDGLISVSSVERERFYAWESGLPDLVVWLLLFAALIGITVLGFLGGLGNHRGLPARIALTLLFCGTIYVILDLDKPHQGLLKVSQSPMLHLQQMLDRDGQTKL